MTGVEIVSDRDGKVPASPEMMKRIHKATYEAGAMVRVGGNNIMMSPPLVVTEAEIDRVLSALEAGLRAA